MNMTSMAPTMVQTVSTALLGVYSGAFSAASARQGTVNTAARASRVMTHFLLRLKYDVKSMINSFSYKTLRLLHAPGQFHALSLSHMHASCQSNILS